MTNFYLFYLYLSIPREIYKDSDFVSNVIKIDENICEYFGWH